MFLIFQRGLEKRLSTEKKGCISHLKASLVTQENICFHATLKELHGEVPAEVLPEELGGDTGPLDYSHCKEATGTQFN